MHVGHCRGAVFGDALANLLAFAGYGVTKEYYINDAGAQIDVLARSAFLRYREALGERIGEIPAGLYPGDYLMPVGAGAGGRVRPALLGNDRGRMAADRQGTAIATMMEMIRDDLAALNIHHDVFFSERTLHDGRATGRATTIDGLDAAGPHLSRAGCRRPRASCRKIGKTASRLLFRATAFGDDIDRPLIKSDGSYTYFAADVAYQPRQVRARLQGPDLRARRRSWRLCQAAGGCGAAARRRRGRGRPSGCASW